MQVLVLDTYNGNRAQAESYRQITGVTAPMLLQVTNGTDYAGARLEDILVVDQEGTVRYWTNGSSEVDFPKVNEMVDALINKAPVIGLNVRQLYFGTTLQVGQSRSITLYVENTGAGAFDITGYSAPEGITLDPATLTVGVNERKPIQITLMPTQAGTYSGTITLEHNNNMVDAVQVPIRDLTIEGSLMPAIVLLQETLSLGEMEVGKSQMQTITITNSGPGPLEISNIQSTISGLKFSETAFTVATGQSKEITITFTPATEGLIEGTLDILSNDPTNGVLSRSISGSAVVILADPRTDFNGSGTVDFADFLSLIQAFGTANAAFDLDGSGTVDFIDFLTFATNFGRSVN